MVKKLLIAFCLLAAPAYGSDWKDIVWGPFGGLNTRESQATLPSISAWQLQNFNVTAGGKSLKKREGSDIVFTLSPTSAPVHNIYNFFDSSGNDVSLFFNERKIRSSVNGGATSVIYSTATNESVWDCADHLGFSYCTNSFRDALFKTDGVSVSTVTITSTGTMVALTPTRMVTAGFSGTAASRIDFSGETDFTLWGTGALGTSPVQFTITAPGSRITHLTYAFGRVLWFKESSFGYIIPGVQPAQSDWVIKTVSNSIGTKDNTSTMDPDGRLYFRGQDKRIYQYDGNTVTDFSSEISGTVALTTHTATEQAYSTYFDNKLWFSVAYSGVSVNSIILIYDFVSQSWTTYQFASDLASNGFLIRNNQLYFGGSSAGNIYLFGGGKTSDDNGNTITATWASKPKFIDDPYTTFDLVNVSVLSNVTNSTPTVSYTKITRSGLSSGSFSYHTGTATQKTSNYINKNVPSGYPAQSMKMFIVETSSKTAIEILGVRAGVRPRSWTPEP